MFTQASRAAPILFLAMEGMLRAVLSNVGEIVIDRARAIDRWRSRIAPTAPTRLLRKARARDATPPSQHAHAAMIVAASAGSVDALIGPFGAPFVDLGAGAIVAAIAARAVAEIVRENAPERCPQSVLRAAARRVVSNGKTSRAACWMIALSSQRKARAHIGDAAGMSATLMFEALRSTAKEAVLSAFVLPLSPLALTSTLAAMDDGAKLVGDLERQARLLCRPRRPVRVRLHLVAQRPLRTPRVRAAIVSQRRAA